MSVLAFFSLDIEVIDLVVFFFFKQKTAYEMRISDWSSDVCSSDLCKIRGISYDVLPDARVTLILKQIADPQSNTDLVRLEKAPRMAVYSPKNKQPWDDAVTLVLTYAEIPYDIIYDKDILEGKLPTYDWLHLHHEDFTGQYGRFWANFRNAAWYQRSEEHTSELQSLM